MKLILVHIWLRFDKELMAYTVQPQLVSPSKAMRLGKLENDMVTVGDAVYNNSVGLPWSCFFPYYLRNSWLLPILHSRPSNKKSNQSYRDSAPRSLLLTANLTKWLITSGPKVTAYYKIVIVFSLHSTDTCEATVPARSAWVFSKVDERRKRSHRSAQKRRDHWHANSELHPYYFGRESRPDVS